MMTLPLLVIERRRDTCRECPEAVVREEGRWVGRKFFCRRIWDGTQDRGQRAYLPILTVQAGESCDRWDDAAAMADVERGVFVRSSDVPVPPRGRVVVGELRALWAELHRRAIDYAGDEAAEQQWLIDFARRVPCGECRQHWQGIVTQPPPNLSSGDAYFAWTVATHNLINRRLDKPEMPLAEARAIYSRGMIEAASQSL